MTKGQDGFFFSGWDRQVKVPPKMRCLDACALPVLQPPSRRTQKGLPVSPSALCHTHEAERQNERKEQTTETDAQESNEKPPPQPRRASPPRSTNWNLQHQPHAFPAKGSSRPRFPPGAFGAWGAGHFCFCVSACVCMWWCICICSFLVAFVFVPLRLFLHVHAFRLHVCVFVCNRSIIVVRLCISVASVASLCLISHLFLSVRL